MFIGSIKTLDLADVTSNLPETEAPAYNPATTYVIGNEVLYDHVIYGCLIDGTINRRPDLFSSRFQTPQYWQVKGPTNAYAAVDGVLSTLTENPNGNIVFTIRNFANIAGVAIFDAFGATATAEFYNASDVLVDTQTINVLGFNLNSYYDWLFTQPTSGKSNHIFDSFPVSSVWVRVTIGGDSTRLGEVAIVDTGYNVGSALYGTTIRVASRSIYEDDEFGVPRYVKRPSRVNSTFEIYGERAFIDTLWGQLRQLSGDRIVYEAQRGRAVTTGVGIVRDISVPISMPSGYFFSLETEGVQ
ncbi:MULTISPECIES: hypothetical protein [unclassified Yoonia]|uniref:hypothetical protein n=1 Tax=unclassified Yoonia TaxID=2629118 RepID=UPI002AFFEBA2|nr:MULTISPECIES: hypothetical protein [unclassified Yoonia]